VLVFGINPGRFGAGLTGLSFTDPVALADICGIDNHLPRRRELSSIFIYSFVDVMGGPAAFYRDFFFTALSPLGFVRGGRNMNFYDDPDLTRMVTPFIARSIRDQMEIAGGRRHAIVLGAGKNHGFVRRLNAEHKFFTGIEVLEHPRFIMQYRRRRLSEYLARYQEAFERAKLSYQGNR
jgi:hypothetical protein